jgi:DNA-binding MarR family transcriptional regulator
MLNFCSLSKLIGSINRLDALIGKEFKVTLNQAIILCALKNAVTAPSDISKATGIAPSYLSRLLGGLEEAKYVERHINEEDRRRADYLLTKTGAKLIDAVHKAEIDFDPENFGEEAEAAPKAAKPKAKAKAPAAKAKAPAKSKK